MRTAFYTVALSAALLTHSFDCIGSSGGPGLHSRSQVPVRGYRARRGTHSCVPPGAHQRTLRRLLIQVVEGCMGLRRMPRGHPALLPPGHIRQHFRLHEAASRRGQRPVQGSDRVHCLTRRRLAAPSGNGGGSVAGRRAMEQALQTKQRSTSMACTSIAPAQRCDQNQIDRR